MWNEVLDCAIGRWTHIWGDPLLTASVSMLLYGVAGLLMLLVARRTGAGDRRLWGVCAGLFFLQVLNTHLDLHALPAAFGHCLARAQGWYAQRGAVKLLGMALIGAAMIVVLTAAAVAWWRSIRANTMLVAGVVLALGFTLIKGTAVNVAEEVYNRPVGPVRLADLLEYSGITLALIAAGKRYHRLRRARPGAAPAAAWKPR